MRIEPYTAFGEKVDSELTELGLSQRWLAQEIDVDRKTITNWLTGKTRPSEGRVHQIAAAVVCDADELQDLLDNPPS
ncbi:MAG TPA: helix-turn-helix transcriptional regulator [Candidatus Saccharimonadales bacterium]|nr:helix-turn-helix transcriptional regulator [Candidatus Saccharimonadales bacterium]